MTSTLCPRCLHQIPNDQTPGAYMGATSRRDNQTEVCSKCGTEEAMIQFTHHGVLDEMWPIMPDEGSR